MKSSFIKIGRRSGKCISVNWPSFDISFHYHLVGWCKLQTHAVGGPSDLSVGVYRLLNKKVHTETVMNGPHKFCHLK